MGKVSLKPKLRALISTRFSDAKQIGNQSTEVQLASCRDYCVREGMQVLGEDNVEALNAKITNTKRIAHLLDFCEQYRGKADVLVVFKLDRFARDEMLHYYLRTELEKIGLKLRSATEPIDESPEGRLMENMLAGFAAYDNRIKSMRTKLSMERLVKEKGIYPWKAPVGYVNQKSSYNRAGVAILDNGYGLADALTEAYAKFSIGSYSYADIRRFLNDKKLLNHKQRPVTFRTDQQVIRFLTNPFYAGILVVKSWSNEQYEGAHQPLIDISTFKAVQARISGKTKPREHLAINPDFPLRDKLHCGYCERKITACWSTSKNGRKYAYYYCPNGKCSNPGKKSVGRDDIESQFMDFLRMLQPRADDLAKILDKILKTYHAERFEFQSKQERVSDRMKKLYRQKRHLLALLSEPEFADDQEAREMLIEVNNELVEVKVEMSKSLRGEFKVEYLIEYAKNFFEHLPLIWLEAKTDTKVRLQRMLFPEGLVYRSGDFSNTKLSPIFEIIDGRGALDVENVTLKEPNSNSKLYEFLHLMSGLEHVTAPLS